MLRAGRSDEDVLSLSGISLEDILGLRGEMATAAAKLRPFDQAHPPVSAFDLRNAAPKSEASS